MSEAVKRVDVAQQVFDLRAEIIRDVHKLRAFLEIFKPGAPYPTSGDFDRLGTRASGIADKCDRLSTLELRLIAGMC